jgi:hypothetical protein
MFFLLDRIQYGRKLFRKLFVSRLYLYINKEFLEVDSISNPIRIKKEPSNIIMTL